MIREADVHGDGVIDYREFTKIILNWVYFNFDSVHYLVSLSAFLQNCSKDFINWYYIMNLNNAQ